MSQKCENTTFQNKIRSTCSLRFKQKETSPKGFSASICDEGNWSKLDTFKILEIFWEFFWIFGNFFVIFLGGFFWRNLFRGIFWENFFGRIFCEEFFGRNYLCLVHLLSQNLVWAYSNFLSMLNFLCILKIILVYSKFRFYYINWLIWVYLNCFEYTLKFWVYLRI